jgi:sialate O-acetylesterase
MAAIALHKTYGKKDVVYTAPIYKKYQVIGDEVHIEFDYPEGSEPFIQDNNLPGFTIAGPDHKWYVASAKTDGKKVIVRSNKVKYPVAVRYGWADNPTCTLHTEGNFPVTPFRTDNWQVSNK